MTAFTASPRTALAIAVALALSACGGGGGGAAPAPVPTAAPAPLPTTAPTAAPTPAPTTPPAPVAIKGMAIDGYISGATVYLDLNNNGARDTGEPLSSTDSKGGFTLTVDPSAAGLATARLRIRGGTDTATNKAFTSSMSAVFGEVSKSSFMVTPLTTVLDAMVRADSATTMAQAREHLAKVIGASNPVVFDVDPVLLALAQPTLLQKMVSLQKSIEILAASDKKSTETDTTLAVGRVAAALGAVVKAAATMLPAQPSGAELPSVALLVNNAVATQPQLFNNATAARSTVALAVDVANLTEATIAASVSQLLRDNPNATGAALMAAVSNAVDTRIAAIAPLQTGATAAAVLSAASPSAPVARLDTIATNINANDQLKALVQATKSMTTVPPASSAQNTALDALRQVVAQVPTLSPTPAPTAAPTGSPTPAPTGAPSKIIVTASRSVDSLSGITTMVFPAGYVVSLINSSTTDGIVVLQAVNASTGDIIVVTVTTSFDAGIFSKTSFSTLTGVAITSAES